MASEHAPCSSMVGEIFGRGTGYPSALSISLGAIDEHRAALQVPFYRPMFAGLQPLAVLLSYGEKQNGLTACSSPYLTRNVGDFPC